MQYPFIYEGQTCYAQFDDHMIDQVQKMLWEELKNESILYVTDYAEPDKYPTRHGLQMRSLSYAAAMCHLNNRILEAIDLDAPLDASRTNEADRRAAYQFRDQLLNQWRSTLTQAYTTELEGLRSIRPKQQSRAIA